MGNFVTEYVKDYPTNISVSVKLYLQTNELRWRVGYEDEIFLMWGLLNTLKSHC